MTARKQAHSPSILPPDTHPVWEARARRHGDAAFKIIPHRVEVTGSDIRWMRQELASRIHDSMPELWQVVQRSLESAELEHLLVETQSALVLSFDGGLVVRMSMAEPDVLELLGWLPEHRLTSISGLDLIRRSPGSGYYLADLEWAEGANRATLELDESLDDELNFAALQEQLEHMGLVIDDSTLVLDRVAPDERPGSVRAVDQRLVREMRRVAPEVIASASRSS